jgi:hypothetical protein
MNIKVRWMGKYVDITVYADNATLELGVLNANERKQLAEHLREVADDLFPIEDDND